MRTTSLSQTIDASIPMSRREFLVTSSAGLVAVTLPRGEDASLESPPLSKLALDGGEKAVNHRRNLPFARVNQNVLG
jgi:hypothetical protein